MDLRTQIGRLSDRTAKTGSRVTLYSRRGTDLSKRFEYVTAALASLPDETVIDGELVRLTNRANPTSICSRISARPKLHIMFYAFDILVEKMKECVWVKPRILAEVEFLEWTGADHLRHMKSIRLRDDKDPRSVVREM